MKTVIMDIMKRSFTELSKESQIILGIIITIITIWEISAFLNMIERKRRWYLLSLAVGILIFSTILMQGLADLARGGHMTESVPGRILEKIPFSYGVLLLALLYGVEYLLWKKEKIVCFQYSSDMIFYNHFHKGKTIILRRSKSGCALQSQSCKNYGAVV